MVTGFFLIPDLLSAHVGEVCHENFRIWRDPLPGVKTEAPGPDFRGSNLGVRAEPGSLKLSISSPGDAGPDGRW